MARRAAALAAAAGLLIGLAAAAPAPPAAPDPTLDAYLTPQTLAVLPDGRRFNLFCQGEGSPVALLAPGWHIPDIGWRRLQPRMAQLTKVCVINRAGYGFSDPGPMPRDTAAETQDLHDALRAAGLKGPYVLMGHSLGGFDARLFAYRYPAETAGLLLLDPPTEHIYQRTREPDEDVDLAHRCAALARAGPLVNGAKDGCVDVRMGPEWSPAMRARIVADESRASWFETIESEDRAMVGRSSDEMVAARRPLGHIPLIVLQADTNCYPRTETAGFDAQRCAELLGQARDSTRGERRIVAGATHMINNDRPDVVVAAFAEIVEAARAAPSQTAATP